MVSFSMDLTSHFIPKEQQELLKAKLTFRLLDQDIRTPVLTEQGYLKLKYYLTGRWDNKASIQKFFSGFDGYVSFIFAHLGNGNLKELQAWAYGDMPENTTIQLNFYYELMMIAVSLDKPYLQERYQYHKDIILMKDQELPGVINELNTLERDYIFLKELMPIIQEAGTALPPYQKKKEV